MWSDRSENKNKRNAFIPFILKCLGNTGFGYTGAKESLSKLHPNMGVACVTVSHSIFDLKVFGCFASPNGNF